MVKLDKDTLVPLGAAGAVVVIGIGALLWLQGQLASAHESQLSMQNKLDILLHDITLLTARVDVGITKIEVQSWIKLLRAENPTLKIPDFDR